MLKLRISLHTICQNSDMFRATLIKFRDIPNTSKAYIKLGLTVKYIKIFVHKMSADILSRL
jgi:hypothetical protein